MIKALFSCGVIILMGWSAAAASETVYAMRTSDTISDGRGASRLLLDFGELPALSGQLVTSATLSIQLSGAEVPSENVVVTVCGVETEFAQKSPTWTTPWARSGGDGDGRWTAANVLSAGRAVGGMAFDVTETLRAYADGETSFFGFLMTVPEGKAMGLDPSGLAVVDQFVKAELRVTHRDLSGFGIARSSDLKRR